jgi:hypothetical protein
MSPIRPSHPLIPRSGQIEEMVTIDEIDPEVRAIVERQLPHLAAKLPPDQGE